MKKLLPMLLFSGSALAQPLPQSFKPLPFGNIEPAGWLKTQMRRDFDGFVGHLDELVPDLIHDPIYGNGRLRKGSPDKDLGNLKAGDAAGNEQYKWWNSETQSNWWDGYIRHAFLLQDEAGKLKAQQFVNQILATQDADGYLGIYAPDLRYRFTSENGELWAKTTLYRALLTYYEATGDTLVWHAIQRAVDNVMQNYPIFQSEPFNSGTAYNGGVGHGLTFNDVLDQMYLHSSNKAYLDYARFLFLDYAKHYQSECDAQLQNILNPAYQLKSHGVHTFEHLRALAVAAFASPDQQLLNALHTYELRIQKVISPAGGAIGDEWIAEREADATHTGYEFCSLQELMHSYGLLMQKTGQAEYGDAIEHTFYNAAMGARHPEASCIAYLKTDNSFEMKGLKNGEVEPGHNQTRYKYSPAHQDVAVCCNPNAGRIASYFVQYAWMQEDDHTLVACLHMPNVLQTTVSGQKIRLEQSSNYPFENALKYAIYLEKPATLRLKIRVPDWATSVQCSSTYTRSGGYILVERTFQTTDHLNIRFETRIEVKTDANAACFFRYGPLLYASPIAAEEQKGKKYAPGYQDLLYSPLSSDRYAFIPDHKARYDNGTIELRLKNTSQGKIEDVILVPLGQTILRQLTFPKN